MTREEYNRDIDALINQIEASGNEYKKVFPIARGGYYPAIKVAEAIGAKIVLGDDEIDHETLIVDDLIDSGATISKYVTNYPVAVVYMKDCDKVEPKVYGNAPIYVGRDVNAKEWIVLPDEHESTIEDNIRRIFQFIGEDANREGLKGTPDRIKRMFGEIFRGYKAEAKPKITTFPNGDDGIVYDSMVLDEGDFYSCCEHHMMPFFGKYWFAYIPSPNGRILGISKIGRVVDYCAARLQVQERLTHDVVDMLMEALGTENPPLGIALVMKGEHLCKTMRGAKKKGTMTSSYLTGVFKEDAALRAEFMSFVKG